MVDSPRFTRGLIDRVDELGGIAHVLLSHRDDIADAERYVDRRWLFTGDTLFWNQRRRELDVTPKQTWFSWDVLATSVDRMAELTVEWVFAGHGKWHQVGVERYGEQMGRLGAAMRDQGQAGWSERPDTMFGWY